MVTKANIVKSRPCPDCETRLHREDFTTVQHPNLVEIVVSCPHCGYEAVVDNKPLHHVTKPKKKAKQS